MKHIDREEKVTQFWEKNNVFERSVEERPEDDQYVFYDGPPFATGTPHYGHILGLTSKDLFPRFWTMRGKRVNRRWGWDCHGLPIENIAEKELGIKKKKEIEEMGIDKFNEFCRSKVLFFAGEWKKTVRRMGKWIEFDNAYKTMDNSYMETVWWIFSELDKKGLVYKGKRILMYCPRCETPLSNSEIAMDNSYKNVTEKTATVRFRLKDEENTFVLAWTTTPWTLIGNVALAVNPELTYVKVKNTNNFGQEEFLILAKAQAEKQLEGQEIVAEFLGKELVGKDYEPLYKHNHEEKGHYVIDGGKEVTEEDGTGIVHMAIYGEFDYQMIKKYNLPMIQHIGSDGKLLHGPDQWKGQWFKKVDKNVIEDLEDKGILFAAEDHAHQYPFCYRCDTPLMYNAVDSWFLDVQQVKNQLIEQNQNINWYPKHLKDGRFLHILQTAPDWTISRNRYWATAMPVWECTACDHREIVGSIKELQEKSIQDVPDSIDLHKHVMDNITLQCTKCNKEMKRIPEVFDCWLESASMPYAAAHYPFENKDWLENNFPGDFTSEYIAQVRAWFYYMHVISVMLMGKAALRNIPTTGNILAADGQKMSKSKKNFPDPAKVFDEFGADALRFYLMGSPVMRAEDMNFREDSLKELYRKVIITTENVLRFYLMFKDNNSTRSTTNTITTNVDASKRSANIMDQWLMSKTAGLISQVTESLEQYDTVNACQTIEQYVRDLSQWYVRRSRSRFKENDAAAIATLGHALDTLAKVIAPIMPFIAEDIYQQMNNNYTVDDSVHLTKWPEAGEQNVELEESMEQVREVVSKIMDARDKASMAVRQPLAKVTIKGTSFAPELIDELLDEVNIKKAVQEKDETLSVEIDTELTPELRAEGIARDCVRKINSLRKKMKLTIEDKVTVQITGEKEVVEAVKTHNEEIKGQVQAQEILFVEELDGEEIKLGGKKTTIKVNKIA